MQSYQALAAAPAIPAEPADGPATPALRDTLFRQSMKHPTDIRLALTYAKVCVALHDYEGAISALERVLYYVPGDAAIQAQLGLLYEQLHSHQMAKQYIDQAVADAGLDPNLKAKVAAISSTVNDGVSGTHFYGSVQAGLRYQSNAAFNPDNYILRLSGQDFVFDHPRDRGADGNGFQSIQVGYDYDLGDQRGDVLEMRAIGYATQQFRFTDLNVGLYDVTLGPRFFLSPDNLPGWSIKPYAAGGEILLAAQPYFASGGAGVIADMPIRPNFSLEPGIEVRGVSFSQQSVFTSLNSGATVTVSLAGTATLTPAVNVIGRAFYIKNAAVTSFQSLDSFGEELALLVQIPSSLTFAKVPWSVSPYVKLLQTRFDAANPYIDASVIRRDNEVQTGLVLSTPLTSRIDVQTNIQYAAVASNIPNYRLRNFSVLTGPTVRF